MESELGCTEERGTIVVMVVPWRTCVTVVEPVIGGGDEVEGEFGVVGGVVGELVGELVGVLVGAVVGCVCGRGSSRRLNTRTQTESLSLGLR